MDGDDVWVDSRAHGNNIQTDGVQVETMHGQTCAYGANVRADGVCRGTAYRQTVYTRRLSYVWVDGV